MADQLQHKNSVGGDEATLPAEFIGVTDRLIENRFCPSGAFARSVKPKACVSMGAE
jgi:hypothetical protein